MLIQHVQLPQGVFNIFPGKYNSLRQWALGKCLLNTFDFLLIGQGRESREDRRKPEPPGKVRFHRSSCENSRDWQLFQNLPWPVKSKYLESENVFWSGRQPGRRIRSQVTWNQDVILPEGCRWGESDRLRCITQANRLPV